MKKSLLLIFMVHLFAVASVLADSKYLMKSGDLYYGEKISESDRYIQIKDFNTGMLIEIDKSQIDKETPAIYSIITNSNIEILGTIAERSADYYSVKTNDGVLIQVEKSKIATISYVEDEAANFWTDTNSAIKPKINNDNQANQAKTNQTKNTQPNTLPDYYQNVNHNYAFWGLGVGTPGLFNALFGYHFENLTIKLHGGLGGDIYGVQSSFLLHLYETKDYSFGISLGLNFGLWSEVNESYDLWNREYMDLRDDYFYSGGSFQIQYVGILLEIGMGVPTFADVANESMLLLNLGYSYSFEL